MKKILFTLVCGLFYLSSTAQSFKLVDPANEWVFSTVNLINGNISSQSFRFSEDSTFIDGYYYHELFSFSEQDEQGPSTSGGFYRQSQDSVFGIGQELVYVFDLKLNDTITLYNADPLVVDSIASYDLLDGNAVNMYFLKCTVSNEINQLHLDNIGSIVTLFDFFPCFILDTGESLLCFSRNGEVLYQRDNIGECWLTNNTDLEVIEFEVMPNPARDAVYLTIPNQKRGRFLVYNLQGQQLIDQRIELLGQSPTTLDVSSLASGNYVLKFVPEDHQDHIIYQGRLQVVR